MAFNQRRLVSYTPPRLKLRPAISLFLAPDRVSLATAMERWGARQYPGRWTGQELLARRQIAKPVGPQRLDIAGVVTSLSSGRKSSPPRTEWLVESRAGIVTCTTREEAELVWRDEKSEVERLYVNEIGARARYVQLIFKIRGHLASGEWKAFLFDRATGKEFQIPVTYWRSDSAETIFYLEDDYLKWRDPNRATVTMSGYYAPDWDISGNIILPTEHLPPPLRSLEQNSTNFLSEDEAHAHFLSQSGPVKSMINGKDYYSWEAYSDHLQQNSCSVVRSDQDAAGSAPAQTIVTAPKVPEKQAAGNELMDATPQPTIKAEGECRQWLVEEMRQSPAPNEPKSFYRADALGRFSGLSTRAFDRAWARALEESSAVGWSLPGRRPNRNGRD